MTREEAIEVLKKIASYEDILEYFENHSVTVQDTCYMAIKALEQEPKMGHWIGKKLVNDNWIDYVAPLDDEGYSTDECRCSECGDTLAASDEYACRGYYCPNCGARMESKG